MLFYFHSNSYSYSHSHHHTASDFITLSVVVVIHVDNHKTTETPSFFPLCHLFSSIFVSLFVSFSPPFLIATSVRVYELIRIHIGFHVRVLNVHVFVYSFYVFVCVCAAFFIPFSPRILVVVLSRCVVWLCIQLLLVYENH